MKLKLDRPLIFFDLETTGVNVTKDRIVQISYIKVFPDGRENEKKTHTVNPTIPIPPESTAVHHITDEMVADKPKFADIAPELREVFRGSDIAGFNSNKFDVPMLVEEFARAGMKFDMINRKFIDVQNIFHKKEERTLIAAYKFYCGKNLEDAHSADADTQATYEVFLSQLERYEADEDFPRSVEEFDRYCRMKGSVDLSGRIVMKDDVEVFNFGKHKGKPVLQVLKTEPSFYHWVMQGDFPKDTKDVLTVRYYSLYPPKKKGN